VRIYYFRERLLSQKGEITMKDIEKEIGEAAGKIWEALYKDGAISKSRLAKATGLSAALVNQGIGWLAREGKISGEKKKSVETIGLKE
jgi:hypothetical protein